MKMAEVQQRAKAMGIRSFGISKKDLIRSIQAREGNAACYQESVGRCDQVECCWRKDCLGKSATG